MLIREVRPEDKDEWARMRAALWPEADPEQLVREIETFDIGAPPRITFVAERDGGGLGGFIEAATRYYANGCETSPVGYIEAWYVDTDLRMTGIGKMLMDSAIEWARKQGYAEVGSDCLIDNEVSRRAHLAVGFQEMERVICFCRRIA